MRVTVRHSLGDLAKDLTDAASESRREGARIVRHNAEQGNRLASGFARVSAGAHGKHYHKAFSAEQTGPLEWEYGPDVAMPQGGMSFEDGSRNQPPHNDIAQSHDIIAPKFHADVRKMLDGLFW